jgi:hypothetical protein
MIKAFHFLLAFLFASSYLMGQTCYRKTPYQIVKKRVVDPKTIKPDPYDVRVFSNEAPYPGGDSYKDFLLRQKQRVTEKYPRKTGVSNANGSRSSVPKPTVIDTMGVKWNHPNGIQLVYGGTPNDNSIAVSDKYMVTAWNSKIYYHDLVADTPLINPNPGFTYITFDAFAGNNITTHSTFDPKILYDVGEKRFILMFLSVDRSDRNNTSKTVIGFSSTENPLDPWNVYEIDGNPRNDGHWSDYPQIALSEDELFFTINLLDGGDWVTDFKETIIWQIDKNSGYRGDNALTSVLWDSISYKGNPVRYIHPADFSQSKGKKNMYFLSNNAVPVNPGDTTKFSYDSLTLVEITNSIASGNSQINVSSSKTNTRIHTPPLGRQPNNAEPLWTNDCRILGAFYHDGLIQFVGMTADTSNGNAGIFHGFVMTGTTPFSCEINILSDPNMDLGYPNIAYVKSGSGNHCSVIGFDHSGPNNNPGMSCMFYQANSAGNTRNYSEILRVFDGAGYINTFQQGSERWGDYYGLQTDVVQQDEVWMAGYYGRSENQTPGVYVARVKTTPLASDKELNTNEKSLIKAYPNPSSSRVYVEFEVERAGVYQFNLYSAMGQHVSELTRVYVANGSNTLSFETAYLPPGTYFINVVRDQETIEQIKLVVKH